MSTTFRAWDVDQVWLLPSSVHDFVPPGHPAHLVCELVRTELELTAIVADDAEARGQPPYHPVMMALKELGRLLEIETMYTDRSE